MDAGLKRAFAAAKRTRLCPVDGCRRVKARGGDICKVHQAQWDGAVRTLTQPKPERSK